MILWVTCDAIHSCLHDRHSWVVDVVTVMQKSLQLIHKRLIELAEHQHHQKVLYTHGL